MTTRASELTPFIYLRRNKSSIRRERGYPEHAADLAAGWVEYDPLRAPDDGCRRTVRNTTSTPCYHGHTWQCPRAVEEYRRLKREGRL